MVSAVVNEAVRAVRRVQNFQLKKEDFSNAVQTCVQIICLEYLLAFRILSHGACFKLVNDRR